LPNKPVPADAAVIEFNPQVVCRSLTSSPDHLEVPAFDATVTTSLKETKNSWQFPEDLAGAGRQRRSSHDERSFSNERYFLIDVELTEQTILQQEDTDGDFQITVKDVGPKSMKLGSAGSHGFRRYDLRGTYVLSNLLQELALAKDMGRQFLVIPESKLNENPVTRLSRMIASQFWNGLTRAIDRKGMQIICADPKNRSYDQTFKIYVPYHDSVAQAYYNEIQKTTSWGLQVHVLPPDITPEYVKTLDEHPGILSLALHQVRDVITGTHGWRGVPFVVPGGRFNEMYGWDSYFETLGLLMDDRADLARCMVDNFCYQIHYYGKILNANRTYYLTRSQPPFLTDMALSVFHYVPGQGNVMKGANASRDPDLEQRFSGIAGDATWLSRVLLYAIKEYYTVWMSLPRLDKESGLSAYHPTGIGQPPETEASHFTHIIAPYASKYGVSVERFQEMYRTRAIQEPDLDRYFLHDRAVRESGHDTTYRLEKRCADLLTVDLNSLLHKYELDIATMIEMVGLCIQGRNDKVIPVPHAWFAHSGLAERESLEVHPKCPGTPETNQEIPEHFYTPPIEHSSVPVPLNPTDDCHWESAATWRDRASQRQKAMDKYLWNEDQGMYFDWDMNQRAQSDYQSVTTLWALWAGVASKEKAQVIHNRALPLFEQQGGLVSGTECSRGSISLDRPNRQWDYPFGWAPHQIIAWSALKRYGYDRTAQRLAYRWLYTITKAFVDFNGTVPEKFDVVSLNHILTVEYGNVGTDFKYVPREGFGWMNASYQVGLTYLDPGMRRKLGVVSPPDVVFGSNHGSAAATVAPLSALH
jgi:alpha,alpha-trehalase